MKSLAVKGYALEDFYDTDDNKEFTKRYLECEQDSNLHGIEVPALDMMKKIMRSAVETGTPFIFFRDTVNAANPNKHAGMITRPTCATKSHKTLASQTLLKKIINEDGTITTKTNTGDMVTCNLNSISLGRITDEELEEKYCPSNSNARQCYLYQPSASARVSHDF